MPQISTREFQRLPLRVHDFLAGVPLHDVWAIDLARTRPGVTLDQFLRTTSEHQSARSPVVQALLNVRLFAGRLFGWDREPAAGTLQTFAARLAPADRSKSLVPAGTRDGPFRIVYRFEDEQLSELINRTAHAAALSALIDTGTAYRFYFAVYVQNVGRFTPLYMAAIDPFRRLLVYPSLLRSIRERWDRTYGAVGFKS